MMLHLLQSLGLRKVILMPRIQGHLIVLPLFGMLMLSVPLPLEAAALSPWVQSVLTRVDTALNLPTTGNGSCVDEITQHEVEASINESRRIFSEIENITQEADLLYSRTICFESDRRLLLEKIQQVYTALTNATKNCDQVLAADLRSALEFIAISYQQFLQNGLNPSASGSLLQSLQPFEEADSINLSTQPSCIYTTDYSPHFIAYIPTKIDPIGKAPEGSALRSYGCDQTILPTLPESFEKERKPLLNLINAIEEFARPISEAIKLTKESLAKINEDTTVPTASGREPEATRTRSLEHAAVTGCLVPPHPLEQNPLLPQPATNDIEKTYQRFLRTLDSGYKRGNASMLPTWLILLSTGNAFTSFPDVFTLLPSFASLKEEMGYERPRSRDEALEEDDQAYFLAGTYDTVSRGLALEKGAQGRTEGRMELLSRDTLELTSAATEPLRSAMLQYTLMTQDFLPKKYLPNFVYFLSRSCVDGHCQKTLKTIAKRTFNDYCIPYLSKKYTDEKAVDKCFCLPSVEADDPDFWKENCSEDFEDKRGEFEAKEKKFYPFCQEVEKDAKGEDADLEKIYSSSSASGG